MLLSDGAHVDQLLLLLLCHLSQAVVSTGQVVLQPRQGVHHDPLHLPAFCTGAGGGQAQPPDAAARPHPAGQHVALVKLGRVNLQPVRGRRELLSSTRPRGWRRDSGASLCWSPGRWGASCHGGRSHCAVP